MPLQLEKKPVKDTVPQVNNELAVGENLAFQQKWWRFEHAMWAFFTLIVIADIAGVFGRGPLANAQMSSADGSVHIKYERVQRFQTPSLLTINLGAEAIRNGSIQLWVSRQLVNGLGAQRIIPQPASSTLMDDGILYTFPASGDESMVQLQLQPMHVGPEQFQLRAAGSELLRAKVFVLP